MRIGLFFSDGIIGLSTINGLIPQMLKMDIEPILFRGPSPDYPRAKIPELKELSYLESGLLREVVEPALSSFAMAHKKNDICLTIAQLTQKYDLELHNIEDVNCPELISFLMSDEGIDGAISIRFYPIFRREIISKLNEKGFLWNLHSGLLPKYKGVFIPYRAIENKEKFYGWTLHHIVRDIDTGPIIATDQIPLDLKKPVLDTYLDMADKGTAMMMGALMFYKKRGQIMAKPQATHQDSYFTFPTSKEIQHWNANGIRFTDDIIQTYLDLFTPPNSRNRRFLKNTLQHVLKAQNKLPIEIAA